MKSKKGNKKIKKLFPQQQLAPEYHFNSRRARLRRQKNCKLQAFFLLACIIFIRAITTRSEAGWRVTSIVTHTFNDLSNRRLQKKRTKGDSNKGRVQKRSEDLRLTTTRSFQLWWVGVRGEGGIDFPEMGDERGLGQKWKLVEKLFSFTAASPFPSPKSRIRLRELSSFGSSS